MEILTEIAWDFVAEDTTRAVDLADDVAELGTRQHYLLGLLANEVPCYAAGLCEAHHEVNVVIEGNLGRG